MVLEVKRSSDAMNIHSKPMSIEMETLEELYDFAMRNGKHAIVLTPNEYRGFVTDGEANETSFWAEIVDQYTEIYGEDENGKQC